MNLFIIKDFRTIVFIFIVISTTFRLKCPPAFFRCSSNLGTYTELQTTPFIESTGIACLISLAITSVKYYCIATRPQSGLNLQPPDECLLRTLGNRHAMCPAGFNKGRSSKFREGSRVRQTREEGRRTYRPTRFRNNNKEEDSCPKTLTDKNHQASSQKFRQLELPCYLFFLYM